VILPSVLRVALPYHPSLYVPLALLHASLLVRIAGDHAGSVAVRQIGGIVNVLAVVLFAAVAARSSLAAAAGARGERKAARTP
jgi:hypothetical protein